MSGLKRYMPEDERKDDGPVYSKLRDALLADEFAPGEHLLIGVLAESYGVSPTPIREALSRLRAERLVRFVQAKGYSCLTPDLKELRDLYCALGTLLLSAIDAVTGRPGADEIGRIADVLAIESMTLPARQETTAHVRAELAEGALLDIIGLAGNRVLSAVAENILARTHAMRRLDMEAPDNFGRFEQVLRRLARTIGNGDRAAAARLINAETDRAVAVLPTHIREIVVRRYLVDDTAEMMGKTG